MRLRYRLSNSIDLPLVRGLVRRRGGRPLNLRRLQRGLITPVSYDSLTRCLRGFRLPLNYLRAGRKLSTTTRSLTLSTTGRRIGCLRIHFTPTFSVRRKLSIQRVLRDIQSNLGGTRRGTSVLAKVVIYAVHGLRARGGVTVLGRTQRFLKGNIITYSLTKSRGTCPATTFTSMFTATGGCNVPCAVRTKRYKDERRVHATVRLKASQVNRKVTVDKSRRLGGRITRGGVKIRLYPADGLRAGTIASFASCPFERFCSTKVLLSVGASGHAIDSADYASRCVHLTRTKVFRRPVYRGVCVTSLRSTFTSSSAGRML